MTSEFSTTVSPLSPISLLLIMALAGHPFDFSLHLIVGLLPRVVFGELNMYEDRKWEYFLIFYGYLEIRVM